MSNLDRFFTEDFCKKVSINTDVQSYFANKDNDIAINCLAQSMIDRFDNDVMINYLESEIMHDLFLEFHKRYIDRLALKVLYKTNKIKVD